MTHDDGIVESGRNVMMTDPCHPKRIILFVVQRTFLFTEMTSVIVSISPRVFL